MRQEVVWVSETW